MESYRLVRVEMELLGQTFVHHEHDPADCDAVYCAEDNRELFGNLNDLGLQWLEIGFAADPSKHTRCALHAKKIVWYWDSGRADRAGRAGQLLAWWQPEPAVRCVFCHAPWQDRTEAGVVNWHLESRRHLDCLPHVIDWARQYVRNKESAALAAEAKYAEPKRKRRAA